MALGKCAYNFVNILELFFVQIFKTPTTSALKNNGLLTTAFKSIILLPYYAEILGYFQVQSNTLFFVAKPFPTVPSN
jgi:hypothetical protein